MFPQNRLSRGFSIVEILIVVAVMGLLASIMIPNLVDAMHKAKQKRTMADMKNTGSAWLSWLTDQIGAASAGSAKTYDKGGFNILGYSFLHGYLRPTDTFFYMEEVPQFDGWQVPYRYLQHPNIGNSSVIMSCSPGRDLLFDTCDPDVIPVGSFLATDYDTDIVWADGYFVRWPEGLKN